MSLITSESTPSGGHQVSNQQLRKEDKDRQCCEPQSTDPGVPEVRRGTSPIYEQPQSLSLKTF